MTASLERMKTGFELKLINQYRSTEAWTILKLPVIHFTTLL